MCDISVPKLTMIQTTIQEIQLLKLNQEVGIQGGATTLSAMAIDLTCSPGTMASPRVLGCRPTLAPGLDSSSANTHSKENRVKWWNKVLASCPRANAEVVFVLYQGDGRKVYAILKHHWYYILPYPLPPDWRTPRSCPEQCYGLCRCIENCRLSLYHRWSPLAFACSGS